MFHGEIKVLGTIALSIALGTLPTTAAEFVKILTGETSDQATKPWRT